MISGDIQEISALPTSWDVQWGTPSPFYRRSLVQIRLAFDALAVNLKALDRESTFSNLVGAADNARAPVHRWYSYKEAFSYRLPKEVIRLLGTGPTGLVVDVFGGVGTTAMALAHHPAVERVVSIDYSPFATFVGQTKLRSLSLSPRRLTAQVDQLVRFPRVSVAIPELSAFHNPAIFEKQTLRKLLSAREAILGSELSKPEKNFFLLGLAAAIEDASGVMKDGRALRILRGRARQWKTLEPRGLAASHRDDVRQLLSDQWLAMIEDLEEIGARPSRSIAHRAVHVRGDARRLDKVRAEGQAVIQPGTVGLFLYSPPYLNCIDYTEVYKLELWLLGFVRTQAAFRKLRLGTLRSHPSIEFPQTHALDALPSNDVTRQVDRLARFLEHSHPRGNIGRMVRNYFDDMAQVLGEQFRYLAPGGHAVCIVGNSTFSRREPGYEGRTELWRLPILTDVLISRIAQAIGFSSVELWRARELRPRNVNAGHARESLVVCRK